MKKKIINFFNFPIFGIIKDIKNYRAWIKTINQERSDPNSKFNKYNLDHNYFYILYTVISLPDEDKVLPDNIKRLRVLEMLKPIHQYLDEDLGFADYITPEFNLFYDEENNQTLTYGIIYNFSFKTLSIKWFITRSIFWALMIWLFFKYDMLTFIKEFINNL